MNPKCRNVYAITVFLMVVMTPACFSKKQIIVGEVESTEIDVGVKIPGRISQMLVKEGDRVSKNQVLGKLESKEIDAKLQAATAAHEEAKKQNIFAQQSFDRIQKLYRQGFAPKQQFDEVEYKREAARQKEEATLGQLNEVKAYYEELEIKSPIDGEVVAIVSNEGEIVSSGYPVITLSNPNNQWVAFYLREDMLKGVHISDEVSVKFPALGDKSYKLAITYMSSLGAFAKWKSTNEQGSFDLKTFEVRARASEKIEDLRSGMTAIVDVNYKTK